MRIRGAAWAGVGLVALSLTACTGDEPAPPPSSSQVSTTSVPTTSEPTVAAPEMPAASAVETDQGAMEFVRHFFALSNYAYQSGDVAPLREVSEASCSGCLELIDAVTQSTADGSTFSGERYKLISVNSPDPQNGKAIVAVAFERPAITRNYPDGTTATTEATPAERVRLRLGWGANGWTVEAIGR